MEQIGLSFLLLTSACAGVLVASKAPKLRARLASGRAKVGPAAEIAHLRNRAVAEPAVGAYAPTFPQMSHLQMAQDLAFLHEALARLASPRPNANKV